MTHQQDYDVHESSFIDDGAVIGKGSKVWHFSHVSAGARIGDNCILGQNVFIAPGVIVGNNVKIQNNVSVYNGVEIGDHAFLGPSCVFTNVINPRSEIARKNEFRKTRVGTGATIGANATVICGHEIGDYAFIAAGAVVTVDVPAYALFMGLPAKFTGWICRCGIRLSKKTTSTFICPFCGKEYSLAENKLTEGHP